MTEASREKKVPRLKELYNHTIVDVMKKEFGYRNSYQVPSLEKIVLNIGAGEAVSDSKKIKSAHDELMKISGQKPVITKARKSIASFKLREGAPVGVKVTLRSTRMYHFLDRFITIALPRVRDFRGLSGKSFDGYGNFAMGIKEHVIFPEVDHGSLENVWGMDIVICTTASTDSEAKSLLSHFKMPFVS